MKRGKEVDGPGRTDRQTDKTARMRRRKKRREREMPREEPAMVDGQSRLLLLPVRAARVYGNRVVVGQANMHDRTLRE